MTRPSRASPSARLRASEPTPAIAIDAERDAGDEDAEAAQARRAARAAQSGSVSDSVDAPAEPHHCALLDVPGAQAHDAVAARGERRRRASPAPASCRARVAGEQQVDDLPPGVLVEIAGRLVGDEDRRIGRQRAGERDALLLAAGQLRRIMMRAARQGRPRRARRARALRRRRRRRARAAPRRSRAPSWSGSGGRTGTRCRHCGRGSGPARPRRACSSVAPATMTVPVSARSSPAMTISSVDLPEPDGPTRPTASPVPICRSMSLRICTRAAPRPSERLTPASAIAGPAGRLSFMRAVTVRPSRSYGNRGGLVQRIAGRCWSLAMCLVPALARAADRPVRIVALGDSLTAGYGLPDDDAFPAKLQARAEGQGHRRRRRQRRRLRRHRLRRPRRGSTGRCRTAPTP